MVSCILALLKSQYKGGSRYIIIISVQIDEIIELFKLGLQLIDLVNCSVSKYNGHY